MATALPGPSGRGNPGLGFIGRRITMGNGKLTVTSSGFGRGRSAVPAAAIGNLEHMGIDDVDNYLGDQVNDRNNGNYGNPLNWDFLETEIEIENPEDEPGLPNSHEITDALEEKYVRNRLDIVKEDGFIVTPLNALRKMAKENATNLHFEYNEIKIGPYKLYLVELFCGAMKGKGESIRRKVAAQMAAADILNELKRRGIPIPVYGLVPGFRLNPLIFGELINLCDQLEFDHPMFVQMPVDPEAENPPLYSYKCQIGQLVLLGSSDNCCVAKRWAAYNMFNALTGYDIPLDRVCMGKDCSAMQRYGLKYQYSEKKAEAMAARQALISASKTEIIEAGGIPALNTDNAADSDAEEELDTALIEGTRGLCLNSDQITEIRDRVALLNLEELDQEVLDEILGEVPVVGEVAGEVVAEVGGKEDDDADSMDWNEEIIFDSTDDEGLGDKTKPKKTQAKVKMESPPVKTKPKRSRHRRSKKAMVSALDAENSGPSPRKPNFKENSPCNEIDEPLESGENKEEFVSVTTKYDDPESNAFAEMLELTYLEKRKEIVELEEGKGGIVTPLVALKITAAELEFPIKFYIYKLRDGGLYFVQVSTGLRLGLGECSRLKMAIQMACADLLDKIQTKGGYILTSHGLPPGCRINPVIFGTLLDVCNRRGYEKPVFLQVESDEYDMSPPSLYTFTCVTGKFLTYGYSDSKCLAKRWAAKRMYEKLTGEIVPLDRVCRGPDIQAWRRFGIKAAPLKKMTKCPVIKPAPSAIQLPTGEYFEEELDFFDIENEQDQNSLQDQLKMNESFAELSISATESL